MLQKKHPKGSTGTDEALQPITTISLICLRARDTTGGIRRAPAVRAAGTCLCEVYSSATATACVRVHREGVGTGTQTSVGSISRRGRLDWPTRFRAALGPPIHPQWRVAKVRMLLWLLPSSARGSNCGHIQLCTLGRHIGRKVHLVSVSPTMHALPSRRPALPRD